MRLFLENWVPIEIVKLLYLDIDILITKNIEELFATDFDTPICAVLNAPNGLARGEHLENFSGHYFNAGVLLINMHSWRELNLLKSFTEVGSGKEYDYLDQDILNLVFQNNWTILKSEYNYLHLKEIENHPCGYEINPKIIHFVGIKPWEDTEVSPYVIEYRNQFERIRELYSELKHNEFDS
jgi:lipopolysaccharide biosynthesis glycosyltransferase